MSYRELGLLIRAQGEQYQHEHPSYEDLASLADQNRRLYSLFPALAVWMGSDEASIGRAFDTLNAGQSVALDFKETTTRLVCESVFRTVEPGGFIYKVSLQ